MGRLTLKQEMFVQGLIAGLSQRQAYKQAYKTDNMLESSIDSKASTLFKEVKIRERYRELLKEFSSMSLWSRECAFSEYEWLKNKARASIENDGVRQANSNAFLSAIDGMNNMAFHDLELEDKKMLLEIEKLKTQTEQGIGSDMNITIIDAWSKDGS